LREQFIEGRYRGFNGEIVRHGVEITGSKVGAGSVDEMGRARMQEQLKGGLLRCVFLPSSFIQCSVLSAIQTFGPEARELAYTSASVVN